jgi:G3E family GTPase
VFLAEPVGSCTDLRASVQYPLRRLYGDDYRIAPLSVLVDPIRALRILNLEPGKVFSPKVLYVYGKQLEEADIIVINKSDLLAAERRLKLEEGLRQAYPGAQIYLVSARTGEGLEAWFKHVAGSESDNRPAPAVDYDIYAEGEALLGWFNATFRLDANAPFDGNLLLGDLARQVMERLKPEQPEIAHFKTVLTPDEGVGDIGVLNLVGSDREPELSHALQEHLASGELIVNLRAEGNPDFLRQSLMDALEVAASHAGARIEVVHIEHFRPARPVPTYRMATGTSAS